MEHDVIGFQHDPLLLRAVLVDDVVSVGADLEEVGRRHRALREGLAALAAADRRGLPARDRFAALCGGDFDGPLLASLDIMMAPTASRVAAIRLKAFAVALGSAGLRLTPPAGDAAGRLN